jgi:hypothetical protein
VNKRETNDLAAKGQLLYYIRLRNLQQMKKEYWDVSDEQVIEKTGKPIAFWMEVLKDFNAAEKKSNEVVTFLQETHAVPRYWARTLTTLFSKNN